MYTNEQLKQKEMQVFKKALEIDETYFTETIEPINLTEKILLEKENLKHKFIFLKEGFKQEIKNQLLYITDIKNIDENKVGIVLENLNLKKDNLIQFELTNKIDMLGYILKSPMDSYKISPLKDTLSYEKYLDTFLQVLSN